MLSADKMLVLSHNLEKPDALTAPDALKIILEDQGMDFDESISTLNLTETNYIQVSRILITDGPAAVVKEVKRIQAVQQEAQHIKNEIERWTAVHPEYVFSDTNKETLLQYLEEQDLNITKSNLERAWRSLMETGRLEEDPKGGLNFRIPGQPDPSRAVDGDVLPRKKVGNMTSSEFAAAISTSKKFRDKVNEGSGLAVAAGTTEAERAMANTKDAEKKRELKHTINQMPSRTYDEWVKNPENRAVVEALYATA
jgi:hypothetical protein